MSTTVTTEIRTINISLRRINSVKFIVLETGIPSRTKDGVLLRTLKIADSTASINLTVWGEMGNHLSPGDICVLNNGNVVLHKSCLNLNCNRGADLTKVGEFCFHFAEDPFLSSPNPDLVRVQASDNNERSRSPPGGGNGNNGGGNSSELSDSHRKTGGSTNSIGGFGAVSGTVPQQSVANLSGLQTLPTIPIPSTVAVSDVSKVHAQSSIDVDMRQTPLALLPPPFQISDLAKSNVPFNNNYNHRKGPLIIEPISGIHGPGFKERQNVRFDPRNHRGVWKSQK